MHCPVCGHPTQWVWRLSPLRLVMAIMTCGFWLWVAAPFELRCKACGVSREKAARKLMIMAGIVTHVGPH